MARKDGMGSDDEVANDACRKILNVDLENRSWCCSYLRVEIALQHHVKGAARVAQMAM